MHIERIVLASKSASILPAPVKLTTLADLRNAATVVSKLAPLPYAHNRREWLCDLRSGVYAISRFLGKRQAEEIPISEIVNIGAQFEEHIRRTAPAMRKNHMAKYRLLLRLARALKCCPEMFTVEDAWERIPLNTRTGKLKHDMIRRKLDPEQITERHLSEWAEDNADEQSTRAHRRRCIWELKSCIRKVGAQANFPHLDIIPSRYFPRYGIGVRKMDPNVRADLYRIVSWLGERNQGGILRSNKVTRADFIRDSERLYGYLVNIRHMPKTVGLDKIFTREAISDCARWLHRSRGWKRVSLGALLSSFRSVLSVHPRFKDQDFSWILDLLNEFPTEPESEKEARACATAFEYNYDALAVIPTLLRDKWKSSPDLTPEARGWIIHDCLLMLWLLTFPWPPACLRRCRIGGKSPNLVRRRIPELVTEGGKPATGDHDLGVAQTHPCWYFSFTAGEVRWGHAAHGPLPTRLVPLLEMYLKHRHYLLQGRSTSTLFLNRNGGEISSQILLRMVGDITEEFVHHRIPPTAFRPIFAYHWLQAHPGDYTNLASILWEGLPAIKFRFDREYRLSRRASFLSRRRKRE